MSRRIYNLVLMAGLLLSGCKQVITKEIFTTFSPSQASPEAVGDPSETIQPTWTIQPTNSAIPTDFAKAYPVLITAIPAVPYETLYPPPTAGPSPTPTLSPTPSPTPTPTATLDAEQGLAVVKEKWAGCRKEWDGRDSGIKESKVLAGLVFLYGEALWRMDAAGRPVLLSCMPMSNLSPKGDRISFVSENDFWFVELETGEFHQVSNAPQLDPGEISWSLDERTIYYNKIQKSKDTYGDLPGDIWVYDTVNEVRRQVTHSPETRKRSIKVWPGHPDWIIYRAFPPSLQPGPGNVGLATLVSRDGRVGTVLTQYGDIAFSPGGEEIAFRGKETINLLVLGGNSIPLSLQEFSIKDWLLNAGNGVGWSPDGKRLALDGWARKGTNYLTGLIILDLSTRQAAFLHPFVAVGSEGRALNFEWSPNNQWIAIGAREESIDGAGLWILSPDGSEEHYLGRDFVFYWSADGRRLIFYHSAEQIQIRVVDTKTWETVNTDLPVGTRLVRWDAPE